MVNFIVLIILHLLGDFYLQTAKIAKCKNASIDNECDDCRKCKNSSKLNFRYIFAHILLYTLPFLSIFFVTNCAHAIRIICVVFLSHGIIDSVACCFNKKIKKTIVFLIDQFLHIGILYYLYKVTIFNISLEKYTLEIRVVFTVILLMAPCSIFINKLFEDLYPGTETRGIFDIGSIIGVLERFLVIIFAYFQNFPAIAIIITVKTWARTEDLKKSEFRNKYLLGTLASLVLALCSYIIFKLI